MKKSKNLQITEVRPHSGVPGGTLDIRCRGFKPDLHSKVLFGEIEAPIYTASDDKVVVGLPESPQSLGLALKVGRTVSDVYPFNLASRLCTDLHPVMNPAIDPEDGAIITTISGGRGQQVEQPLIRITKRGDRIPFHCEIMNPTGLAFSPDGQLYISSRYDGTVLCYTDYERLDIVAEDLGIPCGMVFDSEKRLYVGDRTGKIHRIDPSGRKEEFAHLEPSISAYHLAIDSEDRLYVTGPTFAMRDALLRFSKKGTAEKILEGLARPQGMAFLPDGDLLISAGYGGKKGVFRYSPADGSIRHYITAPILVGLAIAGQDIFLATNSSIYCAQLPGNNKVN
jgi:sugar lactone lactonase YvrE